MSKPTTVRRTVTTALAAVLALGVGMLADPAAAETVETPLSTDFETQLEPWAVRGSGEATATLAAEAHGGAQAALVSGRTNAWNGLSASIGGVLEAGGIYELSAWVKLPAGATGTADIRVSVERDVPDDAPEKWVTMADVQGVGAGEWVPLEATITIPEEPNLLYFETASGTADFLVDDISVGAVVGEVQDLLPIKDTVDFPIGVAIDQRETTGLASELLLKHFGQITAENHMKPEAWYDAEQSFNPDPQVDVLMDYAEANGLALYGHVLVWHSQTPEWFFQDEAGEPLTDSDEDKQFLRERLRTHVFDVAEYLADEHGLFGSETNKLVAWDVVNEVISDERTEDGLRRSEWYRILGHEFIDLAFQYADEAFNDVYAEEGVTRPVQLFINDYNTEQGGKQDRYLQVIDGLLERDVPLDGVGHQFHVSLSTPVSSLDATLARFAELPLVQAVTELDVTVGTPVTGSALVQQGHYYRDAFEVFRAHSEELFSVTIWGLTDNRSWRSEQAPLVFSGSYAAKDAYHGIVGSDELTPIVRDAVVFAGEADLSADGLADPQWADLPLHDVGDAAGFALRWSPDHLTLWAQLADDATEVRVTVGDASATVTRAGGEGAVVAEGDEGWTALVRVPAQLAAGDILGFDVAVVTAAGTPEWNTGEALGEITLVEELSAIDVAPAATAPEIDAEVDGVWEDANSISTDKVLTGDETAATAEVRALWHGTSLYLLAEVTDDVIDVSASDPWVQDSVEFFVDLGNRKGGSYQATDMQIRINVDGELSFGTGDEATQLALVTSATATTGTGYRVEAAIELGEYGGGGTVQGLDVQVNDGTEGQRTGITTWADQTSLGYQNTTRWGVARLLEAQVPSPGPTGPTDPEPTPVLDLYSTPGFHNVNGRWWYTRCEPYSQTIRCFTEIWATQVKVVDGRFVGETGWHFNNLTYLPYLTRAQWASNPLGHSGEWTAADGRQWRTECDTATTGRNGCRSWVWADHVAASLDDGVWTYAKTSGWVLNNIVRFR